jgi:hypothetical protein
MSRSASAISSSSVPSTVSVASPAAVDPAAGSAAIVVAGLQPVDVDVGQREGLA